MIKKEHKGINHSPKNSRERSNTSPVATSNFTYDKMYNDIDDSIVKTFISDMRATVTSITTECIGNDTSSKYNKFKLAPYSTNFTSHVLSDLPIGEKKNDNRYLPPQALV